MNLCCQSRQEPAGGWRPAPVQLLLQDPGQQAGLSPPDGNSGRTGRPQRDWVLCWTGACHRFHEFFVLRAPSSPLVEKRQGLFCH